MSASLRHRSYSAELLDADGIPFEELRQTYSELDTVNRYLGGHATTLAGLRRFEQLPVDGPLVIAEIGCGGGDNLRVIHRHLRAAGTPHRLIGIDLKPECIRYAQDRRVGGTDAVWIASDYRTVKWPDGVAPHIIFSSLFCHHFTDDALVEQLSWLQSEARLGFFINDLQRNAVAMHSIAALTRAFSKSRLMKHDAPLSVRRAFLKSEWQEILRRAGILQYRIEWRWAFRYLITVQHGT